MKKWQAWTARWQALFAEPLLLEKMTCLELPLALLARFSYSLLSCRGMRFLAVLDEAGDTPANYRRYQRELEERLSLPVIFFISRLPAYQYGRMVSARLSFITQGGYAYLAHFFIHALPSRERAVPSPSAREQLSPVAQLMVLRQLLFHDVHGLSLRGIAALLAPYSPMSISTGREELERKGLCLYSGASTRGKLEFPMEEGELWAAAQPFLRSPVQKLRYIRSTCSLVQLPLAGESALSAQTLLGAPPLPVYAVGKSDIKALLAMKGVEEVEAEDAHAVIEHWRYTPALLMRPGEPGVDPLSLYLSLRDSVDDRVRQELRRLPHP